jgi:hypothetical protein
MIERATQTIGRDLFHGSAIDTFRFSPWARTAADAILAKGAVEIFSALMRDQESEGTLLACKHVLDATLATMDPAKVPFDALVNGRIDQRILDQWIDTRRSATVCRLQQASSLGSEARIAMFRERAGIAMLAGCWLDMISQPATQPAGIVNLLFGHYWRLQGEGNTARSIATTRSRLFEQAGVFLSPVGDTDFPRRSGMGATTALYAAFLLSLSRYPVNYLPEVVGIHYAYHALGIDDVLVGTAPIITESEVKAILANYLDLLDAAAAKMLVWRVARSIALGVELEVQHAGMLAEMAERSANQTLDGKVADIVKRHAPFAGKQHRQVRVGDIPLTKRFTDPDLDIVAFLKDFKRSWYVRKNTAGGCRFTDALKLGGPMFGIFTEQEARTFKDWVEHIPDTIDQPIVITSARPTEETSIERLDSIRRCSPAGVVFEVAGKVDDRTLLYRLVNIENFPHVLAIAQQRAEAGLSAARTLFDTGAEGKYTDASFFPYTPDALMERVKSVYWTKLVDPYAPLEQIPSRDDVIFGQKTFALGSLIDGSWVFRIGNAGRYNRVSDGMLFAIYADEMGMGDIRKNHITLIHRVLGSMEIILPHIRDEAFVDQDEIPDTFYAFPINQLCLGLFPDGFYPEIVGYNLGIEMFGLGELRLHEIQKLRHWGLDPIYEEAHLSIDNVSAGHAQQAATIIQSYLGQVERQFGPAAVDAEWRRIWNGYALFAYFAEGCQATEGGALVPADASDHHAGVLI